jgi:uncharacterized protein YceK
MKLSSLVIFVACCALSGCAAVVTRPVETPIAREGVSAAQQIEAIQKEFAQGKTDKAAVRRTLGAGTVVAFDSGYEVWIYRLRRAGSDAEPSELVLLFEPSGKLAKSRVRAQPD